MGFKVRKNVSIKRRKWLKWAVFIAFIWLVVATFQYMDQQLRPQIMNTAKVVAKQMATQAITEMLSKRLTEDVQANQLIVINRDHTGQITSAYFNLAQVSRLESQTTLEVQRELLKLNNKVLYIPAMQTLGSTLFATFGPAIPVRIIPLGSVESRVVPEVRTVGINQSVHILYLDIAAQVGVVVPLVTQPVRIETTIPIAYLVLMGSVPQVVGKGSYTLTPPLKKGSSHSH